MARWYLPYSAFIAGVHIIPLGVGGPPVLHRAEREVERGGRFLRCPPPVPELVNDGRLHGIILAGCHAEILPSRGHRRDEATIAALAIDLGSLAE